MGLRDLRYNGKAKVIGGILAAVLITTVVVAPISIFTDRALNSNDNAIKTYGYDDNRTSTGKRQDAWMGVKPTTKIDASGSKVTSMDATLMKNDNYNSVTTDESLMDGVASTNGLAYLSNSHVSKRKDLKELDISEDQGKTWIKPANSNYISAPLDMVMKVPDGVANVVKKWIADSGTNGATPISANLDELKDLGNAKKVTLNTSDSKKGHIDTFSEKYNYNYEDWLVKNGYVKQFATAVIVYAWVVGAKPSFDAEKNGGYSPVNNTIWGTAEEFRAWVNAKFSNPSWGVVAGNGGKITLASELLVDGSGTDQDALDLSIAALNEGLNVRISQKLNNKGSFEAWETANDLPAGVTKNPDEYDGEQNATSGAFIGTQSRGMIVGEDDNDVNGEISYWGYDEKKYRTNGNISQNGKKYNDDENIIYDANEFLTSDNHLPLATTIASDHVVFFTTTDAKFTVDGKEYRPKGITKEGLRDIFQYGLSWEQVYEAGELEK